VSPPAAAAEEEAEAAVRRSEWRDGRGGITELGLGLRRPQGLGCMEWSEAGGRGVCGSWGGRKRRGAKQRIFGLGRTGFRVVKIPDFKDLRFFPQNCACKVKWKRFSQKN
jgi:hypothetical protein